jgi:hypothetical protein
MRATVPTAALVVAAVASAVAGATGLSACSSGGGSPPPATSTAAPVPSTPTVRLYLLSAAAGAIDPCGCSKDQLGGVDHLAALLESEAREAPHALLIGAGPMLFQDPVLAPDERQQDVWKAETMAAALGKLGLDAWAPAANDWAGGPEVLAKAREASKADFLAANVAGVPGFVGSKVVDEGGVKVGIIGLSDPTAGLGRAPEGVEVTPPKDALAAELAKVKGAGARILVVAASIPRGEALRLAEHFPEIDVLLAGKPVQKGDGNDRLKPATLVGTTLVVEPSNHLQTVTMVDLFVREGADQAELTFADAGGVARAEELVSVSERIRELEARLNNWANDKNVDPADVAARRADLERLRAKKRELERPGSPPPGSFFQVETAEIREKLGADDDVTKVMLGYYARVNEHNKVAFADRKPEPAAPGQASYVGVAACGQCHTDELRVWNGSPHAKAYETLQAKHVEYNLECVGCHVTGYGKPGGSTVTHVGALEDVGCEVCHGPGSRHIDDPAAKGLVVRRPDPKSCVSECHHPPHVEGFDPVASMQHVLGPGHGL